MIKIDIAEYSIVNVSKKWLKEVYQDLWKECEGEEGEFYIMVEDDLKYNGPRKEWPKKTKLIQSEYMIW